MPRKNKEQESEIVSARRAAEILGVSRQQVYLLLRNNVLPQIDIGGYTLIPKAAVEKYKQTRRVGRPPTKKPHNSTLNS